MATGFKERLSDVCITRGISCCTGCLQTPTTECQFAEELAKRCGCPVETVRGWLATDGENMTLREAQVLERTVGVRPSWLLDASGAMVSMDRDPTIRNVIRLARKLPSGGVTEWIDIGEFLTQR